MKFKLFHDPSKIYSSMLFDIENAKKEILLETYIFDKDKVGKMFLEKLVKKAKQGLKIKLLIDTWGSTAKRKFFRELIQFGGEVRFFRKLRLSPWIVSANHERNHRKLLIIDENISYIGSINITNDCINWKEIVFRLEDKIALSFKKAFKRTWRIHNLLKVKNTKKIIHDSFEILEDLANGKHDISARTYHKLLRNAKKEILIVTPYFIPSRKLKKDFRKAIKRGVELKLILPKNSDVTSLDHFRNRYLGKLHKMGVKIYFYPKILHSKILIVDDSFLMGSSNLDYRSFRHQFEINLFGKDKEMLNSLRNHVIWFTKKSKRLNYSSWKKNHPIVSLKDKIMMWLLKNWEEYF